METSLNMEDGRKIKSLIICQCKAQNIYLKKKDKIKEPLRNTSFNQKD